MHSQFFFLGDPLKYDDARDKIVFFLIYVVSLPIL
jgi:hypothetical protein